MAKCILCKAINTRKEAARHPNVTTLTTFRCFLNKLAERDKDAIASVCENHRNPLVFNTVVIDLFKTANVLAEFATRGVPITEAQLRAALDE